MPHCIECGYDLRGLTLPHRCPECGRLAEVDASARTACEWFCSRRALWLRKAPPGFMAHLHETACRRVALRRMIWFVLVPWAGILLLILALNSLTFVDRYDRWVATTTQPNVRLDPDYRLVVRRALQDPRMADSPWPPWVAAPGGTAYVGTSV